MMNHVENVGTISTFLKEHRSTGYSYHDIAEQTGVSCSATKHIIRGLVREGKVNRTEREERRKDDKEKPYKEVRDPEDPNKTRKVPIKHANAYFQRK